MADRLPPGQRAVRGWPVLHEGAVPAFDPVRWRLWVRGAVSRPFELDWPTFLAMPRVEVARDWHCVTTWSRLGVRWGGVPLAPLLERAGPLPEARHALVHAYDGVGYTASLPLEDLAHPDNLLATHHAGEPLAPEHGGPVRLVVHHLYAWKSVKWVTGIEILDRPVRGYWEERGYHDRGDPWREERYAVPEP